MSKLYDKYKIHKEENPELVYIFKSGIFHIFIDEDAKFISKRLGLKITNLNENIVKCGFPSSTADKYISMMDAQDIKYKIIENDLGDKNSTCGKDGKYKKVFDSIMKVDTEVVSPIEALEQIIRIQSEFKDTI